MDLRWLGESDLDRVALTRMRCYAHATRDLDWNKEAIRADVRAKPGDFLLAEQNGQGVGTATALSLTMWARGGSFPCQGVAWVGTVKTHRRRTSNQDGVATQVMRETLRMARERGQVVSALMPFRASFYEHFGYGLVERRNEWTLPLSILPHGPFESIRFFQPEDLPALAEFHQRAISHGQCDIERPLAAWTAAVPRYENGFFYVDRADPGSVQGFLWLEHEKTNGKDLLRIVQNNYADIDALKRQLHFLSSLRDQYSAVIGAFPSDLQLNLLLRETQLPHRTVNHAHAELRPQTRMQVRILDHKRFLELLHLPSHCTASTVVAIRESEGATTTLNIDVDEGRITASPTNASPDFTCPDRVWAPIATGSLCATDAVRLGLASSENRRACYTLDCLSLGPPPYSHEYF